MHYNIYFLLGNIIGVPLIGVRRRRHPRFHVCKCICMHILHFHIVTEKKMTIRVESLGRRKSFYIYVCMYFFFCSSVRWTVKIRINLRIKKLWFTMENSSTKKNWNREAPPYGKCNVRSTFVGFLCFLRKCNIRRCDTQLF